MTTGSQQREMNAQHSNLLQRSSSQQGHPTTVTHKNFPVQASMQETASSTEKLSVNEMERKSFPHGHPEDAALNLEDLPVEVKILTQYMYSEINILLSVPHY